MSRAIDLHLSIPPLHHGDRLSADEFKRRYAAMPEQQKAELLDGMVYLQYDTGRVLDPSIPPLENGDHLTLEDFERRWDNMPDLKKAELLEGVVFMPPPVSNLEHGFPHSDLIYWLGGYRVVTPGVRLSDNGTLRSSRRTESQPDAMLLILPTHGGRISLNEKGVALGTPELAAEVSFSSVSYDLHTKLEIYEKLGVPEYLVWRTAEKGLDWFVLRDGKYVRLEPDSSGILRSEIFPGLWLDWAALVRGDMQAVSQVLQGGLSTVEHATFVKRLLDFERDHQG